MIRRYNRHQILMTVLAVAGGLACYFLAYLFFRYVPAFGARQFGFHVSSGMENAISIGCLIALTFSGWRTWQAGGGLRGYHESALYHDLGDDTAGAFIVDFYAHRVTGPAHVLSQMFLGGPLLLLRSRTLIASLLPHSSRLEAKLVETLALLRRANKWQSIKDYPGLETEILHLAQMGEIDFSAVKGTPRIKAHTDQ